jgi:hypothetical protein
VSTTPIARPLTGERVVALSPENATAAATDWLRRPNLFPGRALTAPTLQQRQRWQAGRIAIRGQAYTAGVVTGLEVGFVVEEGTARFTIQPGRGLTVTGEDVVLAQPATMRLVDLPVVAEPRVFVEAGEPREDDTRIDDEEPGAPRRRVVGATRLGALIAVRRDLVPAAGVLVLQPVTVDRFDFDPTDPCERFPCAERGAAEARSGSAPESFEDWRSADGLRVLWYAWPDEWRALPAAGPRQRNALAHLIFDAEAALADGAALPWEPWGVPVALIAVDPEWQPVFVDRAAVVRRGGRARDARLAVRAGSRLGTQSRLPSLWQARIEQLAEQLAEQGDPAPAASTLAEGFERLPPAGLLPVNVVNLDALPLNPATEVLRSEFFPAGFELDAVPVPIEQLDVAVREAASLAALDFSLGERVRVLVPVTQASFEPRLLVEDVVAPEFQQTLDRFLLDRARALGARHGLRTKLAALAAAMVGRVLPVPAIGDDPLALEPEALTPWGPPPAGGGHRARLAAGVHQHAFEAATETITVAAGDVLYAWVYLDPDAPPRTLMLEWHTAGSWEHRAYWGANLIAAGQDGTPSRAQIDAQLLPLGRWTRLEISPAAVGLAPGAVIDGMAFTLFDGRAAYGPSGRRAGPREQEWFASLLPVGARMLGEDPWEFLAEADLWAPFEPAFGIAPPSADGVPAGGGHVEPLAPGTHQHFFQNATATLPVAATEALFAWVWLDPVNPPRTLMLQWHAAGSWDHRAYWGEDLVPFGTDGTPGHRRMGVLPRLGGWVRLAVPAAAVAVGAAPLDGIAFTLFDGRAAFGAAGRLGADGAEVVWFSTALPAGAQPSGTWSFLTPRQMPAPLGAPPSGVASAIAALQGDPALAPLSGRERAQLVLRGLAGFIAYLTARADRADDVVDYGFVKVQTDVYRVRQLVLGTTAATRLAVSPALATIAKAETAVASQERIASFLDELRSAPRAVQREVAIPRGVAGAEPAAAFEAGTMSRSAPSAAPDAPHERAARAGISATLVGGAIVRPPVGGAIVRPPAASPIVRPPLVETGVRPEIVRPEVVPERVRTELETPVEAALRIEDAGSLVRARTEAAPVIGPSRATTPIDVVNAPPIIGKANVRTTAIAQRLEDPKAIEAKDYTAATRHDAVTALMRLADELSAEDGGVTPALFQGIDVYGVRDDPFLGGDNTIRRVAFTAFLANRALAGQLLSTPVRTRPVPGAAETAPDEGAYFSDSVDLSDNTVVLIRQLEGRIKLYRDAIAAAERTLAEMRAAVAGAEASLDAVTDRLAEARHDVSVARALLAEETERVAAINRRRRDTLAQEVRFLAFVRPRESDTLGAAALRHLDPGLVEPPAPACLREHQDVPDELGDMLRVVREAPARWFVDGRGLIERLDRTELLARVLETAHIRTQLTALRPVAIAAPGASRVAAAIASVRGAQFHVVSQARALATQIDLTRVRDLTWTGARDQAERVVSLGDLIDGDHGRGDVARRAAEAFEQVSRITACLHAELSLVLPSIRLDWAETLSQFDEALNLRTLASLPRWAEIPFVDRRQMQAYADWLFSRIDPAETRAESLVSDVIRMCLLLASHAPVGRIVAGRLARPVTARPGVRIPLTVFDPAKLRVGMQALVYRGTSVVARALVEDIGTAEVAARVLHTSAAQVELDGEARVQFADAAAVALAPARARRVGAR